MPISDLPPELLAHVIRFTVDDWDATDPYLMRFLQDCTASSLVCKTWNTVATGVLYRTVCIPDILPALGFVSTIRKRPDLGAHVKSLRLVGNGGRMALRHCTATLLPNLEELRMSAAGAIRFAPIVTFGRLARLILWGVKLEPDPALAIPTLPALREISLCGVKNLESIAPLFTSTLLPSIEAVAIAYSPIDSDNFLSGLPVTTIVIASAEMRSALGPAGADTTLYTNRFWSIVEGYTDFGTRTPRPKHLQLSDVGQPNFYSPFLSLIDQTGLERDLETIYLPNDCRRYPDAKRVEEWCTGRKIELRFENEIDFMHDSLVPRSFIEQCRRNYSRSPRGL